MITVKVSTEHPDWPFLRQTPGGLGVWKDVRFVVDDPIDRCDYWVVCEGIRAPERTDCPPANVILITWEPPARRPYRQSFLDQFAGIVTCHQDLDHPRVMLSQQGHPWHVNRTFDQLMEPPPAKTKLLSIISSNKRDHPGHRLRLDFVNRLKAELGDAVDLFGRGIRGFDDKWEVLAPYKYSVAIENDHVAHWMTEKLTDCYLATTFPIYFGASNIAEYFAHEAVCEIDIRHPSAAIEEITTLLSREGHFEKAVPHLQTAKDLYMNELSLFPLITRIIKQQAICGPPDRPGRRMTLRPERGRIESVARTIKTKMSSRQSDT